jgi:hypothetical protein
MPQMKMIIDKYKVGESINLESNQELEEKITALINNCDLLGDYSKNAKEAAKELNWDVEFEKVKSFFLS